VLPYALIAFYGIVNQEAAKTTGMTAKDGELLYEGVWYGTKGLITRSKIGQCPLLLMAVEYKDPKAYIGRLDRFLRLQKDATAEPTETIRRPSEVSLDLTPLLTVLQQRNRQIEKIRVAWDERLPIIGLKREKDQDGKTQYKATEKTDLTFEDFAFL
jgi:CRISPR-associated protein Csh2